MYLIKNNYVFPLKTARAWWLHSRSTGPSAWTKSRSESSRLIRRSNVVKVPPAGGRTTPATFRLNRKAWPAQSIPSERVRLQGNLRCRPAQTFEPIEASHPFDGLFVGRDYRTNQHRAPFFFNGVGSRTTIRLAYEMAWGALAPHDLG